MSSFVIQTMWFGVCINHFIGELLMLLMLLVRRY